MSSRYLLGLILLLVVVVVYNISGVDSEATSQLENPQQELLIKTAIKTEIKTSIKENSDLQNVIVNNTTVKKKPVKKTSVLSVELISEQVVLENNYDQQKQEVSHYIFDPSNQQLSYQFNLLKITKENSQIIRGNDFNYLLLSEKTIDSWQVEFRLIQGQWKNIDTTRIDDDTDIDGLINDYLDRINNSNDKRLNLISNVSFDVDKWIVKQLDQPINRSELIELTPNTQNLSHDLLECISDSNNTTSDIVLLRSVSELIKMHSIICNGDIDLSGLESWDHIQNLQLHNISSINNLTLNTIAGFKGLEILIITGVINNTIDIDFSFFPSLQNLKLVNVNIINKYSIANLKSLQSIYIENSNIDSLDFLTGLELKEIAIKRSKLESFDLIENINNLKSIDFWDNNINDISNMENIEDLEFIDLANKQITSIAALKKFKNVVLLDLEGNDIYDCALIENKRLLKYSGCE
ncbi:MAG: hypothetical protein HRU38_02700 [Saccharospirillaceae bacterium]|nr:hypothetical protein [Pseudomonadales bacterium]NRB77571.1 hypothetical protein [Saccharospirillaceae bacterium]